MYQSGYGPEDRVKVQQNKTTLPHFLCTCVSAEIRFLSWRKWLLIVHYSGNSIVYRKAEWWWIIIWWFFIINYGITSYDEISSWLFYWRLIVTFNHMMTFQHMMIFHHDMIWWLVLKGPAGQWGSRQEGVQKYLGNYNSLKWWVINIWWECRKWWIFIIWMCTTLSLFLISTLWRNCSIWWILIIWNVYNTFTFF